MTLTALTRRYLWLPTLVYGVPNLIGAVTTYVFGILLVDMIPVRLSIDGWQVLFDAAVVAGSFYFVVSVIRAAVRHSAQRATAVRPVTAVAQLIFCMQMLTFFAILFFNYGRVGAHGGSAGALGVIASYLKSDLLFIAYYGHVRPAKFPKYNFALYVVNNVLQGWSGFWLMLFFIEIYYLVASGALRARIRQIIVLTVLVMLALPFINALKESARGAPSGDTSYLTAYVKLLNRLQLTTNVMLIAQEQKDIREDYASGRIQPWYMDNGLAARLLRGRKDTEPLQKYVTSTYLIDYQTVDIVTDDLFWYTNVGIAGWLFVIPAAEMAPYLAYVALLIALPYWIIGRFLGARSMLPVVHAATFIYVLHGWLTVQFAFVMALGAYVLLTRLLPLLAGPRAPSPAQAAPLGGLS